MNIIYLLVILLFATTPARAAEVHLKDGRTVTGAVVERNAKSVKIDANGMVMTYFADEIKDIDGAPFVQPMAPAVSAAGNPSTVQGRKRDLIIQFIDVFGTKAAMTQNLQTMMETLPQGDPQAQRLKDNIKVDEILERLVPVYDKQFSEEELKSFIDFYSSANGRKLLAGIPMIMRESVNVSAEYFQEKFPELKSKKQRLDI